jgi:hypothetical protein
VEVARDPCALGLLRPQHGGRGADALGLQPGEHAVEGQAQARHVGGLAGGGLRARAGEREVDALHRPRERLQRSEAPPHDEVVREDGGEDRRDEHEELAQTGGVAEVQARGDARREDGRDDEEGVDGQHLREQDGSAHGVLTPCRRARR